MECSDRLKSHWYWDYNNNNGKVEKNQKNQQQGGDKKKKKKKGGGRPPVKFVEGMSYDKQTCRMLRDELIKRCKEMDQTGMLVCW